MRFEKFYAILDPSIRNEVSWKQLAEQLLDGGARLIQLRDKKATSRELLAQAVELVRLARARKARVVINDRADVAWLARAQGVHIGQTDLSVRQVRKILGPKKIIGISTHNLEQAGAAEKTTASYLAVGPIFPTRTKPNSDPVVGLDGLKAIRRRVTKPIVAIGGITLQNAAEVIAAGADCVAVISDLLCAQDVTGRTQQYIRLLGQ